MAEKRECGSRKKRKKTELRECLLALLEQPFPVTDENGEAALDERGAPLLRTGAQLQSEALFRRALKDTKSFEVLRSAVASKEEKPGKGEHTGEGKGSEISDEAEEAVRRAVQDAVREVFPENNAGTDTANTEGMED